MMRAAKGRGISKTLLSPEPNSWWMMNFQTFIKSSEWGVSHVEPCKWQQQQLLVSGKLWINVPPSITSRAPEVKKHLNSTSHSHWTFDLLLAHYRDLHSIFYRFIWNLLNLGYGKNKGRYCWTYVTTFGFEALLNKNLSIVRLARTVLNFLL